MKTIKVLSPIEFHPGQVLVLSDAQAKLRHHALRVVGEGLFEVVNPIGFKAGEVLRVPSDMPKFLWAFVVDLPTPGGQETEEPAAPKGKAKK